MPKDPGSLNDGELAYDNSSRITYDNSSRIPFNNTSRVEPKRSHQWFLDPATEPELFPNKKQTLASSSSRPLSGVPNANLSPWESTSSFQAVSNQFTDRLFGSELNFGGRNVLSVGPGNLNLGRPGIEQQFGNDASIALSMSHTMEDPGSGLSYGRIRKVKINQVKDSDNGMSVSVGQALSKEDSNTIYFNKVRGVDDGMSLPTGHSFGNGDGNTISFSQGQDSDNGMPVSVGHTFSKGESTTISFSGFQEDSVADDSGRLISNYDSLLSQSSVQTSESLNVKELVDPNANLTVSSPLATTMWTEAPKNKMEAKTSKKMPPNNFPSNVRSLLSTGILDGVPVKYISWSREKELRGTIKGSGYLCGCQVCNHTKVLNAYEFERHANCKTKHPNNHIFFENGKTIYGIVQELRSTPQNLLFEAIQTVTGSPINEKFFRSWKESFQAATRELQRIYGKEEINQL